MEENLEVELTKKSDELHNRIRLIILELENCHLDCGKLEILRKYFHELKLIINEFEPLPTLLDIHLQYYIDKLVNIYMIQYQVNQKSTFITENIGEIIYYFSKIRGFKTITNYFSSDIYLIPRLIDILTGLKNDHEVFLILMWLSNLVLVPFNLNLIQPNLTQKLFDIGIHNLEKHSNASKNQIVSLILLSRLITRNDLLKDNWLQTYFDYIKLEWEKPLDTNGSIKSGHLLTINKILKRCPLQDMEHHLAFLNSIIEQDLQILRYFNSNFTNLNILFLIKILSKLSQIFIIKGDFYHVSKFINHLIHDIMNFILDQFVTSLRYAMAKALSSICLNLKFHATNYLSQLIDYLLRQLETSNPLTNEFLEIVIETNRINIPKYHTILLFIGYISLNKTIPILFLPKVLSIVHQTLFIEQKRFNYTIGSQLRDSSCFIVWSLCRLIKRADFKILLFEHPGMMETMFLDLVFVTIFDSELILRRCGIAVIQEFVGRFGNVIFMHNTPEQIGNFIINLVSLFSNNVIGSHNQSFTLISKLVLLGFDKNLFILPLLDKITDKDTKFQMKVLCSEYLKRLIVVPEGHSIEFMVKYKFVFTLDIIFKTLLKAENSFYFVSDILSVSNDENAKLVILDISNSFNFDWEHDSVEKAQGYLKWSQLLYNLDKVNWRIIVNILKFDDPDLVEPFQHLFLKAKEIDDETFEEFLKLLKRNNSLLSQTVFFFHHYDKNQLLYLIDALSSNLDCEIKANMLNCLRTQLDKFPDFEVDTLIGFLDDYTITNQGDVGSKVRLATLRLIKSHKHRIKNTECMNKKLIRLSGEIFDKIRFESFSILTNDNKLQFLSISQFYERLFTYYDQSKLNDDLAVEFWRGITFSIAATTANSSIINHSFKKFIKFYLRLSELNKLDILSKFLTFLKFDGDLNNLLSRQSNLYNIILNLFVKIFESSIPIPQSFTYDALFIRSYNLHINTCTISRIALVIKIFQHLALVDDEELHKKVRRRIIWLSCNHRLEMVRLLASEALFEVINQTNPSKIFIVSEIDWLSNPNLLKNHSSRLYHILN